MLYVAAPALDMCVGMLLALEGVTMVPLCHQGPESAVEALAGVMCVVGLESGLLLVVQ